MSDHAPDPRARALLRYVGIVAAFGLTIVACWLIALGHSQRQVSLGVIAGLWAALIGAMTFYGSKKAGAPVGGGSGGGGSEVELRQDFALELQREVSARRAYEQQLHEMVRREIETIQRVVGDQLGKLREDVATLRGDLVDQVGGKIRLERIETTRVIGSDIEALQNEVRQLAGNRLTESMNRTTEAPAPSARVLDGQPGAIRPASNGTTAAVQPAHPAQPVPAQSWPTGASFALPPAQALPPTSPPAAVAPVAPVIPAAAVDPVAPSSPTLPPMVSPAPTYAPAVTYNSAQSTPQYSTPVAPPPAVAPALPPLGSSSPPAQVGLPPASANGSGSDSSPDPFASLPRLTRFDDIDDGAPGSGGWSAPSRNGNSAGPAAAAAARPAPEAGPDENAADARRHSAPEEQPPPPTAAESAGGRRRRAEGDTNDVLSRLLGR